MKILEGMAVSFGLESILLLNLSNILVEFDCLEVVRLLNNVTVDLSEVSFSVDEVKVWGKDMRIVSFSHVRHKQNVVVHLVAQTTLEKHESFVLQTPYLEWLN